MPAPYPAHCLCGEIRFRLDGEPLTLYACHCTECQRRSGSAFGLSMWVRRADLVVTHGAPELSSGSRADGKPFHARRCRACATLLWSEPAARPQLAVLRPGTFDDTSWLAPVAHIWTRSAQPWVRIPDDVPSYPMQPEDMGELAALWRARAG